jgi:cysteinyl-tRNA synthetase
LADDLNTAGVIAELHQLSHADDTPNLLTTARILGLLQEDMGSWADAPTADLSPYAAQLAALRTAAMETKNFAPVDALKSALLAAGVEVRMSKTGVELVPGPDFDPAKLEGLL